jgi:hypothetical protein
MTSLQSCKQFELTAIQPAEYGAVTLEYEVDGRWCLVTVHGPSADFIIDEDGEKVTGPLAEHASAAVRSIYDQWRRWIMPPSVPSEPFLNDARELGVRSQSTPA